MRCLGLEGTIAGVNGQLRTDGGGYMCSASMECESSVCIYTSFLFFSWVVVGREELGGVAIWAWQDVFEFRERSSSSLF